MTKEGKAYKAAGAYDIKSQTAGVRFLDVEVGLVVDLYPPDKRRRDIDNVNKILFDTIELSGILDDDKKIKLLLSQMHEKDENPRIECKMFDISKGITRECLCHLF